MIIFLLYSTGHADLKSIIVYIFFKFGFLGQYMFYKSLVIV